MMIEFKKVSFGYGEEKADYSLIDASFKIRKGECVVFCGQSGCGKTTVMRLINGLIPTYYHGAIRGEVCVNGLNPQKVKIQEVSKIVGSVFQNPRSQFFNLDTVDELAFGCENQGIAPPEIWRRIEKTVNLFQIKDLVGRNIFNLSGGEKQKVACASVHATMSEIFVLDEPSSNLDAGTIKDLQKIIGILKKEGKTVVIAEHRLYYLMDLVDRFYYMENGKIVANYNKEELKKTDAIKRGEMGLRALDLMDLTVCARKYKSRKEKVTFSKVQYAYGSQNVLDIKSLTIPYGQTVAVIGKNGAGKSTFVECFCGLKGCKGTIAAEKPLSCKERIKNSYLVMQDVNRQLFTESVMEELLLTRKSADTVNEERILAELDLTFAKELHPMSLSGGQKQRVAIASALNCKKKYLVFDEPTSGLDYCHMLRMARAIEEIKKETKLVIIITHDLEFILKCCSHVLHLENGVVQDYYATDFEGVKKLKDFFIRGDEVVEKRDWFIQADRISG